MMMDDRRLLDALCAMMRIRLFEERVRREFGKGDMPGFVHTYVGAEAVAVGVCSHLRGDDVITSTHRGHGHCLAKGVAVAPIVAELFGRETGLCKGRGGSMHVADFSKGMLGANAIVGGGIALAVGGALAAQTLGDGRVAVTFFGDGASNQGVFHESLNLAAIWRLPVIFVCENNGWAESTPASYAVSVEHVSSRAAAYGIPGVTVDAADVAEVWMAAKRAINRARQGQGPTLLEARIQRLGGHYVGDPEDYRSRDDRRAARSGDPIARVRERLESAGVDVAAAVQAIEGDAVAELDEAFAAARAAPWPDPAELDRDVFAP